MKAETERLSYDDTEAPAGDCRSEIGTQAGEAASMALSRASADAVRRIGHCLFPLTEIVAEARSGDA